MSFISEVASLLRFVAKWLIVVLTILISVLLITYLAAEINQLLQEAPWVNRLIEAMYGRVSSVFDTWGAIKFWYWCTSKIEGIVIQVLSMTVMYAFFIYRFESTRGKRIPSTPEAVFKLVRERMMPGSDMMPIKIRNRYQADVYLREGNGVTTYVGQCFRYGDYLLTAGHVLAEDAVYVVRSEAGEIELLPSRMKEFGYDTDDLALYVLDANELTSLSLKSVNLVGDSDINMCVEVHAKDQKTMGKVTSMDNVFGQVMYDGSTLPGFSGAPYMLGSKCYGLHVGSAAVNIGYDAGYIKALLQDYVPEDTADFLNNMVHRGVDVRAKKLPSGDYLLRAKGKYYRMSADDYDAMWEEPVPVSGESAKDSVEAEASVRVPRYEDSGNVKPASHLSAGVGGLGKETAPTDAPIWPECQSTATQQSQSTTMESVFGKLKTSDMALLVQTLVQLSAASTCTQDTIDLEKSRRKKPVERLQPLKKSTRTGGSSPRGSDIAPFLGR